MSMKQVVIKQYQEKLNRHIERFNGFDMPKEGWIRTARKALSMSAAQLARRMGVTRAAISNTEKAELSGGVTLKRLEELAEAMNCRFVYAIVPEKEIESMIKDQAMIKAKARVKVASTHMALEAQSLDKPALDAEIERIASEIIDKIPSDLWNDE